MGYVTSKKGFHLTPLSSEDGLTASPLVKESVNHECTALPW